MACIAFSKKLNSMKAGQHIHLAKNTNAVCRNKIPQKAKKYSPRLNKVNNL